MDYSRPSGKLAFSAGRKGSLRARPASRQTHVRNQTFYNRQRAHSALDYHFPVDFEIKNN